MNRSKFQYSSLLNPENTEIVQQKASSINSRFGNLKNCLLLIFILLISFKNQSISSINGFKIIRKVKIVQQRPLKLNTRSENNEI